MEQQRKESKEKEEKWLYAVYWRTNRYGRNYVCERFFDIRQDANKRGIATPLA